MLKTLILFLYQYPFRTSEPFMETEIGFLATKFDRIIIFSVNMSKTDIQTRAVPKNVQCYPINCPHNKLSNIIRGLFCCEKGYKRFHFNFKKTISSLYTIGRMKRVYKKALKIVLDNDITGNCVIYSYWLNLPLPAILLKRYFIKHNRKNVVTISRGHGYDIYSERSGINYLPFQKEYIRDLDCVFPCSENGSAYLKSKYPSFYSKISVSRLGTTYQGENPKAINDKINFVTCCRFRKLKRLDLFAKAFSILQKSGLPVIWTLIGDGEEENNLFSLFKELNIETSVIKIGRLQNAGVIDYYRNNHVDFFVNTSTTEGVPVSIMEALSFGIPCIATNVGGTSEILDESCGTIVDKNITPEQLSIIIKNEIENKHRFLKRENAKEMWKNKCSAETLYSEWANKLSKMLD